MLCMGIYHKWLQWQTEGKERLDIEEQCVCNVYCCCYEMASSYNYYSKCLDTYSATHSKDSSYFLILHYTIVSKHACKLLVQIRVFGAAWWQNHKMACAHSEDSDQPGHLSSLIRVFTVNLKKAWVLSYLLSAQWRLWSDWAYTQADLCLLWVHSHFVGFVMRQLRVFLGRIVVSLELHWLMP